MDEYVKELETLSDHKKKEYLKEALVTKRKRLNFLVAKKNCYYNQNDLIQYDAVKEEIKNVKKEISYLQKLKNELNGNLDFNKKSTSKSKKERKIEITL